MAAILWESQISFAKRQRAGQLLNDGLETCSMFVSSRTQASNALGSQMPTLCRRQPEQGVRVAASGTPDCGQADLGKPVFLGDNAPPARPVVLEGTSHQDGQCTTPAAFSPSSFEAPPYAEHARRCDVTLLMRAHRA